MDFKDRKGENLNRKKLKIVSQSPTEMIVDMERFDEPTEEGTQINAKVFNDFQSEINTANTKSTYAVNTANTANNTSTKTLDIVDNLTVSSTEIACTEHISVQIETDSSTKRKNIKFNVPAPKQGKSYRSKGVWTTGTQYVNNEYYIDTVYYSGCTYYCKVSNTNQAPVSCADSTYWGLLAEKGSDAGVTIVDNLTSTRVDQVLSANQGRVLNAKNTSQDTEIANIKNNITVIANTSGGFSCGSGATNGKGLQFKGFTVCDENGKIPAARILNTVYPIGSIYMSTNTTSPATLFGGTWEQLKDRFLIGSGNAYSLGSTGGETSHVLTIDEMPAHRHGLSTTSESEYKDDYDWVKPLANTAGGGAHPSGVIAEIATGSNWAKRYVSEYASAFSGFIMEGIGGDNAHNNMPPYLAVNMWKRIS